MDSFWIAARVVIPMALMMGIGVLLRLGKVAERDTMRKVDKINFRLFLPMLMFGNTFDTDFSQINGTFILYGLAGVFLLFLIAIFLIPKLEKNPPSAAAIGQALIRSNYLMYSVTIAEGIYGQGNAGVLMLLGAFTIPLANALSAILLEVARSGKSDSKELLLAVAKNPLVVAAVIGLSVNFLSIPIPETIVGVVDDIGGLAAPMSFLSLGVSLNLSSITGNKKRLALGLVLKLLVCPVIFMACAIALGFHGPELCGLLVVFCAPTAVSSYPMAVAMDADGETAGQMVIFSTLFSLITIFLWVFGLTGAGLL